METLCDSLQLHDMHVIEKSLLLGELRYLR